MRRSRVASVPLTAISPSFLLEDTMKCLNTVATIALVIFATASASSAFAESGAPGSTPSKPNKVTAVPPPPPPPGGPDKLVTRTQPPVPPGSRKPKAPGVVDDLAAIPHHSKSHGGSTCGAEAGTGVANPTCVASLDAMCGTKDHPGGMRTNDDGSVTCVPAN
jgi:hypothetical protein